MSQLIYFVPELYRLQLLKLQTKLHFVSMEHEANGMKIFVHS